MRIFSVFFLTLISYTAIADWLTYPADLPQFDYSGERLQQHWSLLNQGTAQPWPDEAYFLDMLQRYPGLKDYSLELANQPGAHPALLALQQNDLSPLAEATQNVWRLHYQGQFRQAYELGMQLGPAGAVPALYSKLMYAALLVTDKEQKLALFREAAAESERLLPLAEGYDFAEFGLLYARARTLELLDTGAASSSGYLGSTQDALRTLAEHHPEQALYPASLGGVQAGVVERVGSFVGRITYGATESRALASFEQALKLQSNLPVIYLEFSVALARLDQRKYHQRIQELLSRCIELPVYSAEEALNQARCSAHYQQLTAQGS